MTFVQQPMQPMASGSDALPKPIVIGLPTFRLRCPACATRLVLPANLASRTGSAPCPRCATSISWVGQDELANAWSMEEAPVPATPAAPRTETAPTLVMSKRSLALPPTANEPKTPPLPFPLPPPVTRPPVTSPTTAPRLERRKADKPRAHAAVPEVPIQTPPVVPVENSTVRIPGSAKAPSVLEPTPRPWPVSWIVILVAASSVILCTISLTLLAITFSTRMAPTPNAQVTTPDQQALTATNRELEQTKQFKQQLEEEIQQLKNESQTLQVEIDRLRKEVL